MRFYTTAREETEAGQRKQRIDNIEKGKTSNGYAKMFWFKITPHFSGEVNPGQNLDIGSSDGINHLIEILFSFNEFHGKSLHKVYFNICCKYHTTFISQNQHFFVFGK